MPFFKVDTKVSDHAALDAAGDEVLGALLRMEAWALEHETDRLVPRRLAGSRLGITPRIIERAIKAKLAEEADADTIRLTAPFFIVPTAAQLALGRARAASGRIPESVRAEVLRRDGLVCQICTEAVAPDDVHLDHVVPKSKGGQSVASNLRVAHSACNLKRGAGT